ncbi:MAG: DUF2344 domain-containing protein [Synergistaceae bacterium]|nr:DUF2344 domain-containing protein [Synergistaceae bacterium]
MTRVRLTFSKRGRACFIPHIALPTIFSRAGNRAGIPFELSEGFTPRPRISLGPELSVGVPALFEPFEARLSFWNSALERRWNACLPEGFALTGSVEITALPGTPGAKALSKWCEAASCLLALRRGIEGRERIPECLENLLQKEELIFFEQASDLPEGFFRCIMKDPSRRGPGMLVKALAEAEVIRGWPEVFLLREAVGILDTELLPSGSPRVLPLARSADGAEDKTSLSALEGEKQ